MLSEKVFFIIPVVSLFKYDKLRKLEKGVLFISNLDWLFLKEEYLNYKI